MIDLQHLEQYRENNRIEAKRALGGLPHSVWETYGAFANTLSKGAMVTLLGGPAFRREMAPGVLVVAVAVGASLLLV